MCLYPTFIKNPKYKPNKKTKGNLLSAGIGGYITFLRNAGVVLNVVKKNNENGEYD